jgi:hypothetical protein
MGNILIMFLALRIASIFNYSFDKIRSAGKSPKVNVSTMESRRLKSKLRFFIIRTVRTA